MKELMEVALAAASAGAEVVRAGYLRPQSRTAKEGIDFATETDLASERAIVEVLRKHYPHHAVLGEEGGWDGDPQSAYTWFVDPLCGTMNFAAGVPFFSVNVAVAERGVPLIGVMAEPVAGELLVGVRGEGAWIAGTGERLRPSAASRLLLFDEGNPANRPDAGVFGPMAVRVLTTQRFACRSLGTSLSCAYVARGRMAGAVIWTPGAVHWTAGLLICQEAGCIVRDFEGREREPGNEHCIMGADMATYEEIRALVNG